jgi:hypothetical protein
MAQAPVLALSPGEPIVMKRDNGRMPGCVGVFVGMRDGAALVDLKTDWSSRTDGSRIVRVSVDDIVPIDTPSRRRMIACEKKRNKQVTANGGNGNFVERRWQFKNEKGEAWVEAQINQRGNWTEYVVVAFGRERGMLQTLYTDKSQAETKTYVDRKNFENEVENMVENAVNSANRFVRDRLLQNAAEDSQRNFVKEHATGAEIRAASRKMIMLAAVDTDTHVEIVQKYTGKPLSVLKSQYKEIEDRIFEALSRGQKPNKEDAAEAAVLARLINDKTPKS